MKEEMQQDGPPGPPSEGERNESKIERERGGREKLIRNQGNENKFELEKKLHYYAVYK